MLEVFPRNQIGWNVDPDPISTGGREFAEAIRAGEQALAVEIAEWAGVELEMFVPPGVRDLIRRPVYGFWCLVQASSDPTVSMEELRRRYEQRHLEMFESDVRPLAVQCEVTPRFVADCALALQVVPPGFDTSAELWVPPDYRPQ